MEKIWPSEYFMNQSVKTDPNTRAENLVSFYKV